MLMTMSEQECEHTENGVWLRFESLQAMASVPCMKSTRLHQPEFTKREERNKRI